jgi:hypothetical protein
LPDSRGFAEALLSHFAPPGAPHCFQTFDDSLRKNPGLARTLHGSLDSLYQQLAALNERGAGVFFTVNEVRPGMPRRAENVTKVRAFFADNDKPARRHLVEAEIAKRGCNPSIVVESSPGKTHYYWLTDDCPLTSFTIIQKGLVAALGTDPSVCDLPRVMRLPGFWHRKGAPFLVRMVT